MLAGNPALVDPSGSYESISTVTVGSSGAGTVDFTNISSNYTHLQLRGICRSSYLGNSDYIKLRFNNDYGSNYSDHYVRGDGTSATAGAYTSINTIYIDPISASNLSSGNFGVFVMDIFDYSTSGQKYKTTRTLCGYDANGSGIVNLYSGLWQNTNAITSISLSTNYGNIAQYSSFALYGVK